MEKGLAVQIVVVIGFVCFGAGYVLAGGPEKLAQQYTIGENPSENIDENIGEKITVNVKIPGETTYTQVSLNSGMTVLDAVAKVIEIKTDLTWPQYGPGIKTLDDRWFLYDVNGEHPSVGMVAYQLKGGENIELTLA